MVQKSAILWIVNRPILSYCESESYLTKTLSSQMRFAKPKVLWLFDLISKPTLELFQEARCMRPFVNQRDSIQC